MDRRAERLQMLDDQLRRRGVSDQRVLEAMLAVPREAFVPEELREHAYDDRALPLGAEQTISQPFMVAYMLEQAALHGSEKVLEVGTGSGYQAALLSLLAREVYSVDIVPQLVLRARTLLANYPQVHVELADGSAGLPAHAPFDAIIVAAGAPSIPDELVAQLSAGGRLVIPVGDRSRQTLHVLTKTPVGIQQKQLMSCLFVPLIGEKGWPSSVAGESIA